MHSQLEQKKVSLPSYLVLLKFSSQQAITASHDNIEYEKEQADKRLNL